MGTEIGWREKTKKSKPGCLCIYLGLPPKNLVNEIWFFLKLKYYFKMRGEDLKFEKIKIWICLDLTPYKQKLFPNDF